MTLDRKTNDFSKCEKGQKLWHISDGIVRYQGAATGMFRFESDRKIFYTDKNGINERGIKIIFWGKPHIPFQPDPVKMIMKTEEVFVNYNHHHNLASIYFSRNDAERHSGTSLKYTAIKGKLTFEIEE